MLPFLSSGLCAFLLHPCLIFFLLLICFLLYLIGFVVWKLFLKYLVLFYLHHPCLHIPVLNARDSSASWLMLNTPNFIYFLNLCSGGEGALTRRHCKLTGGILLPVLFYQACKGDTFQQGYNDFPKKPAHFNGVWQQSRSLLLQHLMLGRSSPSLELPAEMQSLHEQPASSELESWLRGTCLGHPAHTHSRAQQCQGCLWQGGHLRKAGSGQQPTRAFPSFLHQFCALGTYAIAFGEISDEQVFHPQCNLAAIDKRKAIIRRLQACRSSSMAT